VARIGRPAQADSASKMKAHKACKGKAPVILFTARLISF